MRRAGWALLTIALFACEGATLSKPRGSGATNSQGGDDEYGREDPATPMPPSGAEDAGAQDAADAADSPD